MKTGNILWLVVAAGAFVALVPRTSDSAKPKQDVITIDPSTAPKAAQSVKWSSGDIALERQPDGHFYADGTIDGRPVHFLVDTGASVVALTGEDASALGLTWDERDIHPIGQSASGTVMGVQTSIDSIDLGGFRSGRVQAVIIPDGLQTSLLGQTFLSQISNVQINGDEMLLSGG